MTRLFPSKLDKHARRDAAGATMMLTCASASLRNFSGEKPFVNPMTGETMHPFMPSYLYPEIARVHAELREILNRHISGTHPFTDANGPEGDDQ